MRQEKLIYEEYQHISVRAAASLGLTTLQVAIIDFYIQNWLGGRLRPYDDSADNRLWSLSTKLLAKIFNVDRKKISYNMNSLSDIKISDNSKVQVMWLKKHTSGYYVGMPLEIIHLFVRDNPFVFNSQCIKHKKPELQCFVEIECADERNVTNENLIINCESKNMESLIAIENKNEWAEAIIHEICILAKKSGCGVFNHLTKENKFRRARGLIDKSINYLNEIHTGIFTKKYGLLFKTIPDHVLEARCINLVIKRVRQLENNREAIKGFMWRCAKNYFMALLPGADAPDYIKKGYPKTIDNFLLQSDLTGNANANFMLFYFAPDSADQQLVENIITKMQNKSMQIFSMAVDYADKINHYDDDVKIRKAYWSNINKLYNTFGQLRNESKTTYLMQACFDAVFRQADELYEKYGGVNKGSFDLNSLTIKNVMREIKDK
ncbi:MAG: hypothetical protein LBR79_00535 [Oscillospiraceae bacterium]|jgi:hypothetical protein|nr:hypothetical protein [Oscillospiraceae bacterium]